MRSLELSLLLSIVPANGAGLQFDHSSTRELSDNVNRFFGHENALTSTQFTSVVRITRHEENDQFDSSSPHLSIRIGDNQLYCKRETTNEVEQVQQHRLRSQLAPLEGYMYEWFGGDNIGINFFPNEKIQILQHNKFVGEYVATTSSGTKGELIFTSVRDSDANLHAKYFQVNVHCQYRPFEKKLSGKICRIGDHPTGDTVIDTIHITTGTVILASLDETRESVSWSDAGCDSDGSWDQTSGGEEFLRLEKIEEKGDALTLTISSPLCERPEGIAWNKSMLNSLCFVGQLNSRHFDFCPNEGRIGIVQVGATKPHVIVGRFEPPNEPGVDTIRNRRLFIPSVSTNLNCLQNLPLLSDKYTVSVAGVGSLSITGVGGSFNPPSFDSRMGTIRGIAVYDSKNPFGCDSSPSIAAVSGKDWIAVVDRGSCMFQEKGLYMQKKGAKAVIVINGSKGGMIAALASIPGKPPLDIPVLLVDREGSVLKSTFSGRTLIVQSLPIEGQSLPSVSDTVRVSSEWYCDPRWADESSPSSQFARSCETGDEVLVYREGEEFGHPGNIVEKLGSGFFRVRLSDTPTVVEEFSGWRVYKDASSPCTAQLGTFVTDIVRSDTCELTVRLHSSILCGDKRMREPKRVSKDVQCTVHAT